MTRMTANKKEKLNKRQLIKNAMKPKVYIETSVISYLTARASRDVVVAGH